MNFHLPLLLLLGIILPFCQSANFSMQSCLGCTADKGFYLRVESSMVDVANVMVNRRGYYCVNPGDKSVHWIFLKGYDSNLGCISGQVTNLLAYQGETIPILEEIIQQLRMIAGIIPGTRRALKGPRLKTTSKPNPSEQPSGYKKMKEILELHNRFRAIMNNAPIDRALSAVENILNPLASPLISFEEKVENFIHPSTTTAAPITSSTLSPGGNGSNNSNISSYSITKFLLNPTIPTMLSSSEETY